MNIQLHERAALHDRVGSPSHGYAGKRAPGRGKENCVSGSSDSGNWKAIVSVLREVDQGFDALVWVDSINLLIRLRRVPIRYNCKNRTHFPKKTDVRISASYQPGRSLLWWKYEVNAIFSGKMITQAEFFIDGSRGRFDHAAGFHYPESGLWPKAEWKGPKWQASIAAGSLDWINRIFWKDHLLQIGAPP